MVCGDLVPIIITVIQDKIKIRKTASSPLPSHKAVVFSGAPSALGPPSPPTPIHALHYTLVLQTRGTVTSSQQQPAASSHAALLRDLLHLRPRVRDPQHQHPRAQVRGQVGGAAGAAAAGEAGPGRGHSHHPDPLVCRESAAPCPPPPQTSTRSCAESCGARSWPGSTSRQPRTTTPPPWRPAPTAGGQQTSALCSIA